MKEILNHPIELGLRALFIFDKFEKALSINNLILLDYLTLYTKDAGGPENLHPIFPYRTTQILIKRDSMQTALNKLISKELLKVNLNSKGIYYSPTELTKPFIEHFESDYSTSLKEKIEWVFQKFGNYNENDLESYINDNIENWGNEFIHEPFFRGFL